MAAHAVPAHGSSASAEAAPAGGGVPVGTAYADGAAATRDCAPAQDGASLASTAPTSASTPAESCTTPYEHDRSHCVLVVYASVGSGHRSAAAAVAQALRLMRAEGNPLVPSDLDVRLIDILDYGRQSFDGNKTASMFVGATRPIYDVIWRYSFTGKVLWGGGSIWSYLMFSPFTEYVRKVKPLAIVATHIVGANAAAAARMLCGQDFPLVCVPTDYETEGLWPHRYCDLFCVGTESMAETLRARKIEEDRIRITGIPTREDFRLPHDKRAMREAFDLPQDKQVVLALAGALLPKPYQRFREALDDILPTFGDLSAMHLVIVAGKDDAYRAHLELELRKYDLDNVEVFGYVEDMAGLMAASDLVVCKSGGLTVTECLCAKTPMVLVGKAYGQEKINTRMLTSSSAALCVTTPRELSDALRYVMEHPQSLDAMLTNGEHIRRPNAARDIAAATMELARVPKSPSSFYRKKNFVRVYCGDRPAHVR